MIFSQDLLFIHVPKTGGTSISVNLFQTLKRPVYYTHPNPLPVSADPGVIWIEGDGHEKPAEARELVARYGLNITRFRLILAVIRNPYAREVSAYSYLAVRDEPPTEAGELALCLDFEGFVSRSFRNRNGRVTEGYYKLDGVIPSNMKILKQENLAAEYASALRSVGLDPGNGLPHVNKSQHANFAAYYTEVSEQAVYQNYKWMFDAGLYARLAPCNRDRISVMKQELQDFKQAARDLNRNYASLAARSQETGRWAQEMEALALQRLETIHTYERMLAPLLPLYRLGNRLKRLVPGR